MAFFVYLLECNNGTYYCGFTLDLEKRIKAHNSGKASKYTRSRLPVKLVHSEILETKSLALKREAQVKKLSTKQKALLIEKSKKARNVHDCSS